jgi:phospholipase/lecithinase/hemolysin
MGITKLLSVAISLATPILVSALAFTQVIVFGDSLSDDAQDADYTEHY